MLFIFILFFFIVSHNNVRSFIRSNTDVLDHE